MGPNMDFMTSNGGTGEVASCIQANGRLDIARLRPYVGKDNRSYVTVCQGDPSRAESYHASPIMANATLRKDEWLLYDTVLQQVSRTRLKGVEDLVSRGLTYNLGNAMGTTVLEYEDVSDAFEAEMTMDGISRAKNDTLDFGNHFLPIPIIHLDFQVNLRKLEASRRLGNPVDTLSLELCGRKVAEKLEAMLFTSTSYAYGGGTIYSYVNFPDRTTHTITSWTGSSKTGADIIKDVIAMKQKSIDDLHYGPWQLYIPSGYETVLDGDYDSTTPGTTIRERILKIDGISGIKIIDTLAANNVLLVQMTSDVVRLVQGMGLQVVQWKEEGNFISKFKVLTIQVPQIRSDYYHHSGIVHASVA